jgi:hypothetical protein
MPIKKALSAKPYGQIFSLSTYDWFRNWFSFEDVIRLLTILSPEKDRQKVMYFFAIMDACFTSHVTNWAVCTSIFERIMNPYHARPWNFRRQIQIDILKSDIWLISGDTAHAEKSDNPHDVDPCYFRNLFSWLPLPQSQSISCTF